MILGSERKREKRYERGWGRFVTPIYSLSPSLLQQQQVAAADPQS
jgi:hypothetical protein